MSDTERTPWPEGAPHPLDSYTPAQLLTVMAKEFGPQRMLEIVGWITVAGVISEVVAQGDPAVLRREMEKRGLGTKTSLYRALKDLRRLGEKIEDRTYASRDHRETLEFVARMSKLKIIGS